MMPQNRGMGRSSESMEEDEQMQGRPVMGIRKVYAGVVETVRSRKQEETTGGRRRREGALTSR